MIKYKNIIYYTSIAAIGVFLSFLITGNPLQLGFFILISFGLLMLLALNNWKNYTYYLPLASLIIIESVILFYLAWNKSIYLNDSVDLISFLIQIPGLILFSIIYIYYYRHRDKLIVSWNK